MIGPMTRFAVVAVCLMLVAPLRACDTPVYRYALENWPADSYRATVVHRGLLSADQQRLANHLNERAASANVVVQVIDLDQPQQTDIPERFRTIDLAAGPALIVNYPTG